MSNMFGAQHRALQDRFQSRKLADLVDQVAVHAEIDDEARAFIESRDMFYLATVDARGFPSCSYKGGDPGFIRVIDNRTIAFPSYDGNGMFYSMGNIAGQAKVGMLFIDFETPHRLRLHGTATVSGVEADLIVRVQVEEIFINCPRYVHRYKKDTSSKYVPRSACETPLVSWKRIDLVQDALTPRDQGKAAKAGGLITIDEYFAKVKAGDA
jgi:uncharacterized protein